jgi:hypothetical protein
MTDIPEGHGIIAGRSGDNARAALAAADAAGVSQSLVLAVDEGYLVPDAVLEAFHAALDDDYVAPDDFTVGDGDAPGSATPPEDVPPLDGYYSDGPHEPGYAGPPEDPETAPEGAPTSTWKNADIEAWAEANGVDLGGATKKADMLAAISSADTEEE